MKTIVKIIFLMLLVVLSGCSNANSPVIPDSSSDMIADAMLPESVMFSNSPSVQGILGGYELSLDPETRSVELTPKRNLAEGESYIVNGLAFFTISPCPECLRLRAIEWKSDSISVLFTAEHPFEKGNTSEPPTAKNRLDLDIFDMALVINPTNLTPLNYPGLSTAAYNTVCKKPDGYTSALSGFLGENAVLPYFLVIDDNQASTNTFNKFEMGSSADFIVDFKNVPATVFDLYLIFGYGISARLATRLSPTYYNPEFNWKAPWKVEAYPPDRDSETTIGWTWDSLDTTRQYTVEVYVYDWQIGANVDPTLTDPSSVYASSEIESVSVEVPGMTSTVPMVLGNQSISGDGSPSSPLQYQVSFANELGLAAGVYTGLVKVLDSRAVGSIPPGGTRDFLVDITDEIQQEYHNFPEFATYQTFTANVVPGCDGYCWANDWGNAQDDIVNSIDVDYYGNVYVVGDFCDTVIFDKNSGAARSSNGNMDAFLAKYDSFGNLVWLRAWGGVSDDSAEAIIVGDLGLVFVTGWFEETVDFNPGGVGGTKTSADSQDAYLSCYDLYGEWLWTKTWGGPSSDEAKGLAVSDDAYIYVVGQFYQTCDFDPDGGGTETSKGVADCFVSYFYFDNGDWLWAKTWGGTQNDFCESVSTDSSGNAFITGEFWGTPDFDPNGGSPETSNGDTDVYLTKFSKNGAWQWAKVWGGTSHDTGQSIDIDGSDYPYIMGEYYGSVDFNPAGGGTKVSNGATKDCFLSKFNNDGTWQWTEAWGGPSYEYSYGVWVGYDGFIYTGGGFTQTVDFNPSGGGTEVSNGASDSFISVFNSSGTWQWVETWGGSDTDEVYALALDTLGNMYAGGIYYEHTDLDPDGGDERIGMGGDDCYFSRFRF
jgi:hypothetical protein